MNVSSITLMWIILALLVLLIVFSIYLTILRLMEKSRLKEEQAYIDRSKNAWMSYLYADSNFEDDMIPQNSTEMRAAERLLIKFLNSIYVEGTREKIQLFANQYMSGYYRKMLSSPEWSHRMNGLYRAIDFKLVDVAENHVARWENKKFRNPEENYYFSVLKMMTGHATAVGLIKNDEHIFSEQQTRALLLKLNGREMDDVIENYRYLPQARQLAVIDVIGEKSYIKYQQFLIEQLRQEEKSETRIRILKSLEHMGYLENFETIQPFVESEFWEERMLAVRLMGLFPLEQIQQDILPKLEDSSWWVRSAAAKAIARQKNGELVLTKYQNLTTDRYAKEIISEQFLREAVV